MVGEKCENQVWSGGMVGGWLISMTSSMPRRSVKDIAEYNPHPGLHLTLPYSDRFVTPI